MKQKWNVKKLVVYMLVALFVTIPFSGCVIGQGNAPKLSVSVNSTGTATITVSLSGLDRDNIDPETNPGWNLYSVYCLYAVSAAEKTELSAISLGTPLWDTKQIAPVKDYISKHSNHVIRYDVPKTEVEAFRATNGTRPTSWTKTFTGLLSADASGVSTDYIVLLHGRDCVGNGVQYADGYYGSNKVTLTSSFTGGSTGGGNTGGGGTGGDNGGGTGGGDNGGGTGGGTGGGSTTIGGGDTSGHTHTMETFTGYPATCTQPGLRDCYFCKYCAKYYEDVYGMKEITQDITVWRQIPSAGHACTLYDKVEPTCTQTGSKEYYHCVDCWKYFEDAENTKEITDNIDVWKVLPAKGHSTTKHEKQAATCTKDGSKEYYSCSACGNNYEDAYGRTAIPGDIATWAKIPATGHTEVTVAAVPARFDTDGTKEGKKCSVCNETISGMEKIYKVSTVKLSEESFVYDGRVKTPGLIIKDSKGNTLSGKYYTVTRENGRTNVGKYTYKVTLTGDYYKGEKTLAFLINPDTVKLKSLQAGSKKLTVKWAKNTKQVTGYEVQYSTDKSFSQGTTKTVTVKKNTTTSKNLTKLKAKKKYYVRVRTYKKAGGVKYVSKWSNVKKATTKK